MNIIKGFVSISQYINNLPGEVSVLGELSTWARTYSKEQGEYTFNEIPGYKLTTFKSVDTVTGNQVAVSTAQVEQIIKIVRECVVYGTDHIRPYSPIDFMNVISASFYDQIMDFTIGSFADNGVNALPEWISWKNIDDGSSSPIKIWLSDAAFIEQYEDYEIVVIPPLTVIDDFFGYYQQAVNQLDSVDFGVLTQRIQAAKGDKPETYLRIINYEFINNINPDQRAISAWAVLIYGKAGDNIDTIKDAIVDYVLVRSLHTRTEWETIIPDLFKRTEFVIYPRWDKYAIPNLATSSAIYSSLLDPNECVSFAVAHTPFYNTSHVQQNITIMPFDYKALSLIVVNGLTNIEGRKKISTMFSDYIPVSTTSLDFNRMLENTRSWVLFLQALLIAAETATIFTTIPGQFRRTIRNNILFISGIYGNVNYLVAAKSNSFYTV